MNTITTRNSDAPHSQSKPVTILGMSLSAFTKLHVVISLVGIAFGFVVLAGMFASNGLDGYTALFLTTTMLTSVTGFFFKTDKILPSQVVGGLSVLLLTAAILALYFYELDGSWRWIYVVTAVAALYLNVFVLVVQSFLKVPALHALAPKGNEAPFAITQAVVLLAFVALGVLAVVRFHPV